MPFHADNPGRGKVLALFQRYKGEWIPLPMILRLGVAQYNARIRDLREAGYVIENKTDYDGATKLSWFRLVRGPKGAKKCS